MMVEVEMKSYVMIPFLFVFALGSGRCKEVDLKTEEVSVL